MWLDCFGWVPFCGVTKSCMRGGGCSGGALLVSVGVGLFAGINEIGRFTNARRRKVLMSRFFLKGPHAAVAEVTRRGGVSCCLSVLHRDHTCILKGLFQAICE